MPPDAGGLVLVLLFGGWAAVDGASFGQFMISRPLVAATVAGWIAGSPVAGAALGVVLEAFQLMVLPVGAARYPEAGPAAVAAGAGYAWADPAPGLLVSTVAFYFAWEWAGGETVRAYRRINGRAVAGAGPADRPGRALERRVWAAVAADFVRGVLLVAAGLACLRAVYLLGAAGAAAGGRVVELVMVAAVVATLTGSLRLFGMRTRWFAIGVTVGLLVLLVRR